MAEAGGETAAFRQFEAEGWNRAATAVAYDRLFGPITGRAIEPLLDAAGVGAGTLALDIATGPGYVAAEAAARGADAVGVDVSAAMVELARARNPGLEFRQAPVESLPFPDGSFEAVVGNFILLHLADPDGTIPELVRVLVPGGRLALTVWDTSERAHIFGVMLDAVAEAGAERPPDLPTGPDFFRFSDEDELSALLAGAGLEEVSVETVAFEARLSSPDDLWDGMVEGTVRTRALIRGQSGDVRARIRSEYDRLLSAYRTGDGFSVPVSVKLGSGRRGY